MQTFEIWRIGSVQMNKCHPIYILRYFLFCLQNVSGYHVHVQCLQSSEESISCPRTVVTDSCEPQGRCWDQNPGLKHWAISLAHISQDSQKNHIKKNESTLGEAQQFEEKVSIGYLSLCSDRKEGFIYAHSFKGLHQVLWEDTWGCSICGGGGCIQGWCFSIINILINQECHLQGLCPVIHFCWLDHRLKDPTTSRNSTTSQGPSTGPIGNISHLKP